MGVIEDTGMSDRDKMEMMIEVSGIHTQEHRIVYLVSDSKIDFLNHLYVVFRFFSLFLLCCKSYAFSTNS